MNTATIKHEGKTVKRITRAQAKRLYEAEKTFILVPCNQEPFHDGVCISKPTVKKDLSIAIGIDNYFPMRDDFNTVTSFFQCYFCTDSKIGRYPAFYAFI